MTVLNPHPNKPRLPASSGSAAHSRGLPTVYVCVFAAALSCASLALPMLVAGIASIHSERALNQWESADDPPTRSYWELTLKRAERAVAWYPVANGEYLDRLGRVRAWSTALDPADGDPLSPEAAVDAFRQSTLARPTWPWTWLRLAYGKSAAGSLDEEFDLALHSAVATGSGRVDVNRALVELGFGQWAALNREQRALVLSAAGRAVSHSTEEAKRIHSLARVAGVEQPLCWSLGRAVRSQQQICTEEG
ncbi:hypothetical protein [Pseudomonas sp.]|uniref:hypothetical protein n=1 Tax=Pseudomonas sp. TaxID=306 RepID=UPI00272ACDA0|nr:hypothetical protein [Pseudomonas sp.]